MPQGRKAPTQVTSENDPMNVIRETKPMKQTIIVNKAPRNSSPIRKNMLDERERAKVQAMEEQIALLTSKVNTLKVKNKKLTTAAQPKEAKKQELKKPAKAMSLFFAYCHLNRAEVIKANPNMPLTEISKLLGAEYQKISQNPKKMVKYQKIVDEDKARYEAEREKYLKKKAKLDKIELALKAYNEEQEKEKALAFYREAMAKQQEEGLKQKGKKQKKIKDPNAPKKSKSAYMFYVLERMDQLKSKDGYESKEAMKTIGSEWQMMNDNQKAKYNKLSIADKLRYAQEKEAYEIKRNEDMNREKEEQAAQAKELQHKALKFQKHQESLMKKAAAKFIKDNE